MQAAPGRRPATEVGGTGPGATGPGPAGGYSATAVVAKLGIRAGHHVVLCDAPDGWQIDGLPPGVTVTTSASQADVVVAFCRSAAALAERAVALGRVIMPDGCLWVAWPRRAAGHRSDITDNVVRDTVLPLGLVDVKVAALGHDWSALKVVWRRENRRPQGQGPQV